MFFFFKQKTAYELRISDWSSDVCSSDLNRNHHAIFLACTIPLAAALLRDEFMRKRERALVRAWLAMAGILLVILTILIGSRGGLVEIGRASCRERVCQYGYISGVAVS